MKEVIDHQLEASAYLWLDNLLLSKGQAFANNTSPLKPYPSEIQGLTAYRSPHRQWVYDDSVSGALVPPPITGNGGPISDGAVYRFNYNQGEVLAASSNMTMAGSYSYKEVNLYFSQETEERILFHKPLMEATGNAGYAPDERPYPCIFIRYEAGENETLDFCGLSATTPTVRLVFLANSQYLYRGVCSLLRDSQETHFPIFKSNQLPFNGYGGVSGVFNYSTMSDTIQDDPNRLAFIRSVRISNFSERINLALGPRVIGGFIDLEVEMLRFPRI